MKVPEIILAQQRERPGGFHLGVRECAAVQFGALDDPDSGEPRDAGGIGALPRRHDDRYPFAIAGGEFLDDTESERIVSADDQVIVVVIEAPRDRRHGVI